MLISLRDATRVLCWMATVAVLGSSGCSSSAPQAIGGNTGATGGTATSTAGVGSTGPTAGATAGVGGQSGVEKGDLPCPVAQFLELHCLECHGKQPRMGAPVSLMDAGSFARPGMSGLGLSTVVLDRIQNMERPMPPEMLLSASETSMILPWLKAGAPADPNGCLAHDPFQTGAAGSGSIATAGVGAPSGGAGGSPLGAGGAPGSVGPLDPTNGWPMFGGDLGNSHANLSETAISPTTVANLKELWTFRGTGVTATPAIADGVVYLPTWGGTVHALDARTGVQKWMTALPDLIDSSPALSATQVFVGDDQGSVHALDRATGVKQWSKVVDMHAEAHLWSSPIYVQGAEQVIVGVASGEEAVPPPYSFRGNVVGLDAKTGTEKWRVYTTTNDASSGPGVGVWGTVAVDATRKLVFVGTGNAYEGTAGPHVDSLLAINYETGMLQWAKQFTSGDVFSVLGGSGGPDFDIGASANLFTAAGKDIVGVGIKSGDYVALERDTGNMVWVRHLSQGSVQGGIIATPAYAKGMVFAASNTYPSPQTVTLAGIDAESGNVVWMTNIMSALAYGALTYANGVLFAGLTNAAITGFDAQSGKQLWTAKAPDSIAGGPSVANGVLYVPWGYMWTLREGSSGAGGLTAYGMK